MASEGGSFENEDHSKTKHPRPKTKHPKVETGPSFMNTRPMLIQQESKTITNKMYFKSTQVVNAFPPLRGRPDGMLCCGRDQKTKNAQTRR